MVVFSCKRKRLIAVKQIKSWFILLCLQLIKVLSKGPKCIASLNESTVWCVLKNLFSTPIYGWGNESPHTYVCIFGYVYLGCVRFVCVCACACVCVCLCACVSLCAWCSQVLLPILTLSSPHTHQYAAHHFPVLALISGKHVGILAHTTLSWEKS